ncbi:DUF5776 domain-containing protein [Levilactobacillus hammesii]|uniref:DUF5776 domain-containing protein n=1 Tax=Levilactobacillus hammesii DSM 16381 TaxID=1423753 RepID=A0A0R1V5B6_9LACO|nr:DUF5776 domain-containing protein [Levilactobacillus hammesii]KRL98133.1 hypothetical protein FD28_GL000149 [Levilactobacillus hammesii DSM 16381]
MHNKKKHALLVFISLLVLSISIGIFSTKTIDGYAQEKGILITGSAVFKEENSDKPSQLVRTWTVPFDRNTISGITYDRFFQRATLDYYVKPYTFYDELNILFQCGNNVITLDQAMEKYKSISARESYEESPQEFADDVNSITNIIPQTSVDYSKTKLGASQSVIPIADGADGTTIEQYKIPDFVIYLVSNDYTMTIKYVKPDGSSAKDDRVVSGYVGEDPTIIDSPAVPGYVPDQKSVKVDFDKTGDYSTIVHYTKQSTNAGSTPAADQTSLTANKTAAISVGQSVDAATFNAKATDRDGKDIPVMIDTSKVNFKVAGTYPVTLSAENGKSVTATLMVKAATADSEFVAQKKSAILAVKPIYLYQKSTLNKQQRLTKYAKAPHGERPMFVVLGYAHSKSGLLRYHVKDVNHESKIDGKTGYVTANSDFVTPAYYQKTLRHVKILSKSGVNAYRKVNLTGETKHLKKNQTVKVIGLEHHNLTTRFKLSNGNYISANKNLVETVK